jgi:NAD(P)-dependent dehydrogenase (short-subunit alcohol dehydrogenase family)
MSFLDHKVALVTGVTRRKGIGAAVALALAWAGADVGTAYFRPYDRTMPWSVKDSFECFFSLLTRQARTQSVQRSKKDLKDFLLRYLKKYSENPTPFTWTKGPDQLQRIIEATKEYQAAHPKQPKQRKAKKDHQKN